MNRFLWLTELFSYGLIPFHAEIRPGVARVYYHHFASEESEATACGEAIDGIDTDVVQSLPARVLLCGKCRAVVGNNKRHVVHKDIKGLEARLAALPSLRNPGKDTQ